MAKKIFFSLYWFSMYLNCQAQIPANITLNSQQNITTDTYDRAKTSIKLSNGFKYSAANSAAPLLNLSIGSLPTNIGTFYQPLLGSNNPTSAGPQGPIGCSGNGSTYGTTVGETEGDFSVSSTGAATYRIPIYVSPGTGGIEPSLSIVYNSQGGTGLLGKGYDLSGLSSITRTGKNLFNDGVRGTINLDLNDVYSMDGNRLFVLTGQYGSSGSTYYAENESFSTIIAHGQQGNGPQWIEVIGKNGSTYEYGNTSDSRLVGVGDNNILTWKLNKITDEFGNYMQYTYSNLSGESVIKTIDYTGNSITQHPTYNSVNFVYEPLGEKNTYYFGGVAFHRTQLLQEITILAEGQMAKKYTFDYLWQNATLLGRVTETDANGNDLYPTVFCWNDVNYGNNNYQITSGDYGLFVSPTTGYIDQSAYTGLTNTVPADLDGDGFSDVICIYGSAGNSQINVLKNELMDNFKTPPLNTYPIDFASIYKGNPLYNSANFYTNFYGLVGANVCDENLDNKQEAYIAVQTPISSIGPNFVNTYSILKTTFNSSPQTQLSSQAVVTIEASNICYNGFLSGSNSVYYSVNDYTGDGVNDKLLIDPDRITITSGSSSGSVTYTLNPSTVVRPIEFDGDGMPEYVMYQYTPCTSNGFSACYTGTVAISVLKYTSSQLSVVYTTSLTFTESAYAPDYVNGPPVLGDVLNLFGTGDFNGDGKTDITCLALDASSMSVLYSTGTSFSSPIPIGVFSSASINGGIAYSISTNDLNSDGKSDITLTCSPSGNASNNYFTFISLGDIFVLGPSLVGSWDVYQKGNSYYGDYIQKADFNGDGTYDIFSINDPSSGDKIISTTASPEGDFLYWNMTISSINTALNKTTNINYVNINSEITWDYGGSPFAQIFSKNSQTTFSAPLYNYKPYLFCVYETEEDKGKGQNIVKTTRYRYYDAIFHKNGRGFLGFENMATIDVDPNSNINFNNMSNNGYVSWGNLTTNSFDGTYFLPLTTSKKILNFNLITNTYSNANSTRVNVLYDWGFNSPIEQVRSVYSFTPRNTKGFFLSLTSSTDQCFLSSTNKTTAYTYDVNSAGNIIAKTTTYGSVRTENVTNAYVLNHGNYKLQSSIATATQASQPSFSRETDYAYDSDGHLTTITNDPTLGNQTLTTSLSDWDDYGHALTKTISAGDVPARTSSILYDTYGRFVTKQVNALGDAQLYIYEPKFGKQTQVTDISGLVTNYEYDGLGRIVKTTLPNNAINTVTYSWDNVSSNYLYAGNNDQNIGVYSVTSINEGQPFKKSIFNTDGKVVETETQDLNGNPVFVDYKYATKGNTTNSNLPEGMLIEVTEAHSAGQVSFLATKYEYDTYLRKTSEKTYKFMGGAYTYENVFNSLSYAGATTTTSNQLNIPVTKTFNDAGQITSVINTNGSSTQTSTYTYHSVGKPNNIVITNNQGGQSATITMDYDALGYQKQIVDPSAGTINYTNSTVGDLLYQSDATGNYTYVYDNIGRVTSKTGSLSGVTTYNYVTVANGRELIDNIVGPNSTTQFTYDNLSRKIKQVETLSAPDGTILETDFGLDKYGRVSSYTYPGGFGVNNTYNNYGYLTTIKTIDDELIWQVGQEDALGQINQYSYGNGITTTITRDDLHYLQKIVSGNIYEQDYVFTGTTGNPQKREYKNGISNTDLLEGFTFDNLDRLTNSKQQDPISQNILRQNNTSFDIMANITHKDDDFSTGGTFNADYAYNNTSQPYTLTNLNNVTGYANYNTLSVIYNDFGKVSQLSEMGTNKEMDFVYGNDNQRIKMSYLVNGQNQYNRYYTPNYDMQKRGNNKIEWNYIYSPTGLAAVYYNNNGSAKLLYAITDHLGSPIMLIDQAQNIVEEYSFDSWGRRRNPVDWSYDNVTVPQYLNRGFTFHEHIDEFALINMNGRVYDPQLGRFIQADIDVQQPDDIQNFNRYAYCLNNPLKYTDPSGHWFGYDDLVEFVVGFAVGYVSYGLETGDWGDKALVAGAIDGALFWVGANTFGLALAAAPALNAAVDGAALSTEDFLALAAINTYIATGANSDQLQQADQQGWNGVALFAGYSALAVGNTIMNTDPLTNATKTGEGVGASLGDFGATGVHVAPVVSAAATGFGNTILAEGYDANTNHWDIDGFVLTDATINSLYSAVGNAVGQVAGNFVQDKLDDSKLLNAQKPSVAHNVNHQINGVISTYIGDAFQHMGNDFINNNYDFDGQTGALFFFNKGDHPDYNTGYGYDFLNSAVINWYNKN